MSTLVYLLARPSPKWYYVHRGIPTPINSKHNVACKLSLHAEARCSPEGHPNINELNPNKKMMIKF